MDRDESNRSLLDRWKQGDEFAAKILFDRYMVRLAALVRARLSRKLSRRLDPEDVVLSAWRSFFMATRGGRIEVPDDDDLWPLLLTMTLRKLRRQVARQLADKRSAGREAHLDADSSWMDIVSRDPSPQDAALLADDIQLIMERLDASERDVLVLHLQGFSTTEIAEKVGCSDRTVRRALARIREHAASLLGSGTTPPPVREENETAPSSATHSDSLVAEVPNIAERDILLQRFIGRGGFGKVYRALDRRSGRIVAVKYLSKRLWQEPAAVASFQHEVAALSRLSHPNIVEIEGWGQTAAGAPFIVMEYVEGVDLNDTPSSMPIADVVRIVRTVADGVAAAHAQQIIHGDLTPANVLLEAGTGRVVLTDFGFSRISRQQRFTLRGGTPAYLAPEQVSDAFANVTERTDVYGLGGILYYLLTGQPPVTGESVADIMANVVSSRPPMPPSRFRQSIPLDLEQLTLHCLAKEPANRPASAATFAEAILAFQQSCK